MSTRVWNVDCFFYLFFNFFLENLSIGVIIKMWRKERTRADVNVNIYKCLGPLIVFSKLDNIVEVPAGSSAQIMCQMKSPVRECQWSWRQLNQSQPWNLEVKRFPAFGNDSTDCSIKFKNVLPEQEGYWTCGARIDPNSSFTQSNPIRFLISEGERRRISIEI